MEANLEESPVKDRIIELLGRGIPAVSVAMAVGCDESYISQIVSQEGVAERISNLKMAHFQEFTELDDSLNQAEKKALEKVANLVPFITKPSEAARVYSVLNAAKRRTADAASASQAPSTIVSLDLPQAARVSFITDHNRQVIEIDSRPLVTLPATSVVQMAEQKRAAALLNMNVPRVLDVSISEKL